jgi:hypothetical protein
VPASAGQADVVDGAKYKAKYSTGAGMEYNLKLKVAGSGKSAKFTLNCAGISGEKIQIKKGHFKLEFGADEVQLKGRGHFLNNDEVKGAITKIITPGATCAGGGDFFGTVKS